MDGNHPLEGVIDGLRPLVNHILRPDEPARGSYREHRYYASREFLKRILSGNRFRNNRIQEQIAHLSSTVLPSLNRLSQFAEQSSDENFRRITVIRREYITHLLPEHLYFFDLLIKASDKHYIIDDIDATQGFPPTEPHDSDFCIWQTPSWEIVTDYYPSSKIMVIAWEHSFVDRKMSSVVHQKSVGSLIAYYHKIFEQVRRNRACLPIDEYTDRNGHLWSSDS